MRLSFVALAAALASSGALAQRLDTLQMSCGEARGAVARAGAIVLSSGPNLYDRYVSSSRYCGVGEAVEQGFAPTRDAGMCPVGGLCRTPDSRRFIDD